MHPCNQEVKCPYCGHPALQVTGESIYPHRPDLFHKLFWSCAPCDAYVGTHARPAGKPLGRLANASLRKLKRAAHAAFDPIWKNKHYTRGKAYLRLANAMSLAPDDCHIGMFSEEQCSMVINICNQGL